MPKRPIPARLERGLDESLGFLICDTARFVKRALYPRLAPKGIPGSYWFLLRLLWREDGSTQRELSERLGIVEPAVVIMLRGMERLDLVRRERDATDRRKMRVFVTEHGSELEPELMKVAEDVNCAMLEGLNDNDDSEVKAALRVIREHLAKACGEELGSRIGELEGTPYRSVEPIRKPPAVPAEARKRVMGE